MNNPVGIYIHVPFCRSKCPYCDFYSVNSPLQMDAYTSALCREILNSPKGLSADTVYFGGGTPSVLGAERIGQILGTVKSHFNFISPEITLEVNPKTADTEFFKQAAANGVNRISVGLQSSNPAELRFLGRTHTPNDAARCVKSAQGAGIENISLDLMLGLENQTLSHVRESIRFCAQTGAVHLSMYLLKIEKGTPFYKRRESMCLPNDDDTAELYLGACHFAEELLFAQYEISNFSKGDFTSKHNLKYWNSEDYLGFGPSAHSCFKGKRFYTPPSLSGFVSHCQYVSDGESGGFEEYAMLKLRLSKGLSLSECENKFGTETRTIKNKLPPMIRAELIRFDGDVISLTPKGFLVSNSIISAIIL